MVDRDTDRRLRWLEEKVTELLKPKTETPAQSPSVLPTQDWPSGLTIPTPSTMHLENT